MWRNFGVILLISILFLFGCKGEQGDPGPTGAQGEQGEQGPQGETGPAPQIWMYMEVFSDYDADGLSDSWEFTLSETVPFTTSGDRVLVSLEGVGVIFDNSVASGDIGAGIDTVEVIGGNTIKISGGIWCCDPNWYGEPYSYQIGFSVMAYDYSFDVKAQQNTRNAFREVEMFNMKKKH
jgi:hypothetical protein